jgi:HlyD family secretion protein
MKAKNIVWIVVAALGLLGILAFMFQGKDSKPSIEYHYAKAEKGEVVQSIQATGLLMALTTVDVKSKAGGIVTKLYVKEGDRVKAGDPIADIDPRDTQAAYDQAAADLRASQARTGQAVENLDLEERTSMQDVRDASAALAAAKIRLDRARINSDRQPALTQASITTAEAAYKEALAAQDKLLTVTLPQQRRDADGNVRQTKSALATAQAAAKRAQNLLGKGYIPQSDADNATSNLAAAKEAYEAALQHQKTIVNDLKTSADAQAATVARLKASLEQAQASASDTEIQKTNLAEAEQSYKQAVAALAKAQANRRLVEVRKGDIVAARAQAVHDQVSMANARVQLDSTKVVAPRDGVVTLKYLEEGTIVPPGTSTFAQGTSLVQLSDISSMFVNVTVDEADISNVKLHQTVRVTAEAYKGMPVMGTVDRIFPSATTTNNVTTVTVQVKISQDPKAGITLRPGMNATCEFITLSKKDVIKVPSQAVSTDDDGKSYVQVKSSDPQKPEHREVKIGVQGNDDVEILSGLKEGEEVVTAAIDVMEALKLQQKMIESQQGGGLAGGGNRGGRSFGKTATKK